MSVQSRGSVPRWRQAPLIGFESLIECACTIFQFNTLSEDGDIITLKPSREDAMLDHDEMSAGEPAIDGLSDHGSIVLEDPRIGRGTEAGGDVLMSY